MYDFSIFALFFKISIVPLSNQISSEGVSPLGTFRKATPWLIPFLKKLTLFDLLSYFIAIFVSYSKLVIIFLHTFALAAVPTDTSHLNPVFVSFYQLAAPDIPVVA